MNSLQKRAWIELVSMLGCAIVAGPCLVVLVALNARGLDTLSFGLTVGAIVGLVVAIPLIRAERRLDERERRIREKAFIWSARAFVALFGLASLSLFFSVGGRGAVPVLVLPALFFACLLVAQLVQSAVILVQCALEQDDVR